MSRIADIAKTMKTWWNKDDDPFVHRALDEIIRIDQEQLLTIEPKRGEWVALNDSDTGGYWKCSVCGTPTEAYGAYTIYKFCPFCGACMRGKDDED